MSPLIINQIKIKLGTTPLLSFFFFFFYLKMAKGTSSKKGIKTVWKGIQKKAESVTDRPASITSQESRKTIESKSSLNVSP